MPPVASAELSVLTRRQLLERESLALTEAFGLQHGAAPAGSLFFSDWWTSPSGRTALFPVTRAHFLAVPCSSVAAVGRMAACVSYETPDTVTHHLEGACPFRTYEPVHGFSSIHVIRLPT